jgi:hypothetical protein
MGRAEIGSAGVLTRGALALLSLLAGVTLAGCGNNNPAVCSDVDNLQKSVDNLTDIQLNANTVTELQTGVSDVRRYFDDFARHAKEQYADQSAQLRGAVDGLSTGINAAKAAPGAGTVSAVVVAVQGVGEAARSLTSAVKDTC